MIIACTLPCVAGAQLTPRRGAVFFWCFDLWAGSAPLYRSLGPPVLSLPLAFGGGCGLAWWGWWCRVWLCWHWSVLGVSAKDTRWRWSVFIVSAVKMHTISNSAEVKRSSYCTSLPFSFHSQVCYVTRLLLPQCGGPLVPGRPPECCGSVFMW